MQIPDEGRTIFSITKRKARFGVFLRSTPPRHRRVDFSFLSFKRFAENLGISSQHIPNPCSKLPWLP